MTINVIHGDCRSIIPTLGDNIFDACVTDPPYGLNFMGKKWDTGAVAFDVETWKLVFNSLKPGAHLLAFGGTRTSHRMVCAIEDAGFEIRDVIMFLYGTGFPKSLNLDKAAHDIICTCSKTKTERELRSVQSADVPTTINDPSQFGEILFPCVPQQSTSCEMDPRDAGACNSASQRPNKPIVERRGDLSQEARELRLGALRETPSGIHPDGSGGWICDGASTGNGEVGRRTVDTDGVRTPHRPQPTKQPSAEPRIVAGQSKSQNGGAWPLCRGCGKPIIPTGFGTALKPAYEPIIVARKPLIGTVAENVLRHGTGALNIDGCRVGKNAGWSYPKGRGGSGWHGRESLGTNLDEPMEATKGRWPANVIHDGSDEVLAAFAAYGERKSPASYTRSARVEGERLHAKEAGTFQAGFGDTGTAARFFYSAKAGKADRAGSKHPTVKPIALMRYLCRLVTPPGGTVLDPFAGSGTTGQAANLEGFSATLIENEAEYVADINRRLNGGVVGIHPED